MKYGCCTTIDNYEILEQLGYDYIELAGNQVAQMPEEEFQKVRDTIQNGAVKCCGFNAALPPDIILTGKDFDIKKAREYAMFLCRRGSELGILGIGIGSPKSRQFHEGDDIDAAWRQTEEFLAMFAEEAQKYHITVMYESLNKTESLFGIKIREGADLVSRLSKPNLKIVFDIYHMYMEKEAIEELLYALPYIHHVHIAERVGEDRKYPSEALYGYYKEVLRPVIKSGYKGAVSTEVFESDIKEGAQRSIALLKKIVSEIENE